MAIPAFLAYLALEKKYSPLTVVAYRGDLEDYARADHRHCCIERMWRAVGT